MYRSKNISDKQLEELGVCAALAAFESALEKTETIDAPTASELSIAMHGSIIVGALTVCLSEAEQGSLVEVMKRLEVLVNRKLQKIATEGSGY